MRLLAACGACRTQYDVTGHKAGDGVHCRCGAMVIVPERKIHEARVVRCAGCGGSRGKNEENCSYCGARFSISDKGWGSMCPSCFCRLPIDAKHCVECGIKINPRNLNDSLTKLPCPRCTTKLSLRTVDQMDFHECNGCGGIWLSVDGFSTVCKKRQAGSPEIAFRGLKRKAFELTKEEEFRYIPCPKCQQLMNRRNYASISGVVIDTCRECGVWLDNEELGRIMKFIEANGLERAQQREMEHMVREARQAENRSSRDKQRGAPILEMGMPSRRNDPLAGALGVGLEVLGYLAVGAVKALMKNR